jgi:hemerythrin-like domain-containing protein
MIEHRLIEKMIAVLEREVRRMTRDNTADPVLIATAVDFIKTYADRCHHGKEEDILFRDLKKKPLSDEHARTMNELIEDHKRGRALTAKLVEANEKYAQGDNGQLATIKECLGSLVDFYPKHIEKEDKHFFIPVMDYFTQDEKDAMLNEEMDFDQRLIHEKYQAIVASCEKAVSTS